MYFESKKKGLALFELATKIKSESSKKVFPYTNAVCSCRYCSYCSKGKCTLKHCCCMSERVRARTCTFRELLNDSFRYVEDSAFHYRLRIASERAQERKSCFLNQGHRRRFYNNMRKCKRRDPKFIGQLYLLTSFERLWEKAHIALLGDGIDYGKIDLSHMEDTEYLLFWVACDLQYGGSHIDSYDLADDEAVDFEVFQLVCYVFTIYIYGMEAIKIAEKKGKRDE